ncbi:Protein of unknown function [Bacillus cereus]|nr:Protein of unknown function [Bacillus cereus]
MCAGNLSAESLILPVQYLTLMIILSG